MKRTLEPEVMESIEEAEEFNRLAWKRQIHARNFLKKYLEGCKGYHILDVGSGPATLPIYVASLNPNYRIDCIELSDEMNKIAGENIRKKNLESRIRIIKTDAKNMALPDNSYDIVICHNMLHQIANPLYVINEIVRVVKPKGSILIRDILRPKSEEQFNRIMKKRDEDLNEEIQNNELKKLHDKVVRGSAMAAFTLEEVKDLVQKSNLKNYKITKEEDHKGYLPHVLILKF